MTTFSKIFENKAFIPFITCGYPNLETTEKIIEALAQNGADLIELGIPFLDCIAEGEVIENANLEAIKQGVNTDAIFKMLHNVAPKISTPLAFMTYANVVFSYGIEKFLKQSQKVGIKALILPDVPFEERDMFVTLCLRYGIHCIAFIAPTSKDRIAKIAKEAKGFIYCISSMGVTGIRDGFDTQLQQIVADIKQQTKTPVAIGFGISTPNQAKEIVKYADGVIIGSAIVKLCKELDCVEKIAQFAKEIKNAITQ